jgi:cytochrome P450
MASLFLGHAGPYEKISEASSNVIRWLTECVVSCNSSIYRKLKTSFPRLAFISQEAKEQIKKNFAEAIKESIENGYKQEGKDSLVKEMIENSYTLEQIQSMIATLFVAGQDNLSNSLMYALLKLAQDVDLQDKIYNENLDPLESKYIRSMSGMVFILCSLGHYDIHPGERVSNNHPI